jgi:hypothetical protein
MLVLEMLSSPYLFLKMIVAPCVFHLRLVAQSIAVFAQPGIKASHATSPPVKSLANSGLQNIYYELIQTQFAALKNTPPQVGSIQVA